MSGALDDHRSHQLPPCNGPVVKHRGERIFALDNLRALAMLLGIYLHAAFAYANPSQTFWLATDPGSSVAVDGSIWFIHLFRMSLFFLLSGYFAKRVIASRGGKSFLWGRFLRIAVPFAIFYPFLLAAFTIVIVFSMSYVENPKGLMGWVASGAKDTSSVTERPPWTTMHLWFLYYLFMFNVVSAFLLKLPSISSAWLFQSRLLWLFLPLLLIPGIVGAGVPVPAPESFIPEWWPFLFYGPFYFLGWQIQGREDVLERLGAYVWPMILASVILFGLYYASMPTLDLSRIEPAKAANSLRPSPTAILCTAYLSVLLTIAVMLLGKRYLNSRNALLSFIADSSYWMYLIHLPIVLFLQTLLIPVSMAVWLKLAIVLAGTSFACLATYVVFVRYTPLGWLLHGKRSFP